MILDYLAVLIAYKKTKMKDMELGEKIQIDHYLVRVSSPYKDNQRDYSKWEKRLLKDPVQAIVIGKRNLSNGFVDFIQDEGVLYTADQYFTAFKAVKNMRENSFYFVVEDIPSRPESEKQPLPLS